MSTQELQIDLIKKISEITDEAKLRDLLRLLKFQSQETPFITTEEDKKNIAEAQKQIKEGKVISNEMVQKEIEECLRK